MSSAPTSSATSATFVPTPSRWDRLLEGWCRVAAMSGDGRDRAWVVHARFRERGREQVLPLVDDALIAEHEAEPFGPHSDRLERVLAYVRAEPLAGKEIIVCEQPFARYRLARLGASKGDAPVAVSEIAYSTLAEAEHAVFLLRIASLRSGGS